MALTSELLGFKAAGAGGQHLLFTVPAGERWLLRDARVYNGTGGVAVVKLMQWDPTVGGAFILSEELAVTRVAELQDAFIVFEESWQLYVSSTQGDLAATISGHRWVLP